MKIKVTKRSIYLTHETEAERKLLHNIQYRGISYTQLLNLRKNNEKLSIILGPDYLKNYCSKSK